MSPTTGDGDDRSRRILERMLSGLKIAIIVTIYFSLCALIILIIIGATP